MIGSRNYLQCYTQKEFIGRGTYGKVYLIVERKTLQIYVAKKIETQGLSKHELELATAEVQIHRKLKHPNIIEFKEYFSENGCLIIILEHCQYGDLSLYIKQCSESKQHFQENLIMNLFLQMAFGLKYLHQNKVIHRDIKTQNIFINAEGKIKLADFGIAKLMETTNQAAMTLVGTPYYLSPEACSDQGLTNKSDIWSLGCVLYEMCSFEHAFESSNVLGLAQKITNDPTPDIPNGYSKELNSLVKQMLSKKPEDRPSVKEILEMKLIQRYTTQFTPSVRNQDKEKEKEKEGRFYINHTETNLEANQGIESEYEHTSNKYMAEETGIISTKSSSEKLKEKCIKRMGAELFSELYQKMRSMKAHNKSELDIEKEIKRTHPKHEFDLAMDVAQLIYIEDNSC